MAMSSDTFMLNQCREWLANFAVAEIEGLDDIGEWQREAAELEAQEAVLVTSTALSEVTEQDELTSLREQVAQLTAERDAFRQALQPFMLFYEAIKDNESLALKGDVLYTYNDAPLKITHLKQVADALGE